MPALNVDIDRLMERRHIPILNAEYCVCIGTVEEIQAYLKRKLRYTDDIRMTPAVRGQVITLYNNETGDPIWVMMFPPKPDWDIVVHELYHVVTRILDYKGIEDEETGAYLMGYLFEEFV